MKRSLMTISLTAILASAPALAADGSMHKSEDGVDVLSSWSYGPLYEDGRSISDLLYHADLYGPGGDKIGSVENVIFTDGGEAKALIAEIGGFWDFGDTHVTVPWDEVTINSDQSRVTVPVTEESVADYTGFYDGFLTLNETGEREIVDDDLATGPQLFKATDLIGDFAALSDRTPYGYVSDLVIDADGDINAVVVQANAYGTPGYYAYPYGNGGRDGRYSPYYGMPYDRTQIDTLEQFDYDKLNAEQS